MTVKVPKCLNSSADAANMHACWVVFACSTLQYGAVHWNVAKLDLLVRHVFLALHRNYCWSVDPLDAAPESKLSVDVDSHAST